MKKFRRCYHPPISPQHFQHSTKKKIMDPLHQTTSPSSAWRGAATLAPTPTAMESPTKRSLKGFPFESKSHGFGGKVFFGGGEYERWSICSAISGHEIEVFELIFLTKSGIPKSLKVGFLAECVWDLVRELRAPLSWKVWCQVYPEKKLRKWKCSVGVPSDFCHLHQNSLYLQWGSWHQFVDDYIMIFLDGSHSHCKQRKQTYDIRFK